MKKAIIIVSLIALCIFPCIAQYTNFSVGLEAGIPDISAIVEYDINDDWSAYAKVGYPILDKDCNLSLSLGADNFLTSFRLFNSVFPSYIGFNASCMFHKQTFAPYVLTCNAIGKITYDFEVANMELEAYLRLGLGAKYEIGKYLEGLGFNAVAEIGCLYHI